MEAVVLLDRAGVPLHWHIPPDRSPVSIPDSRPFWDVIWENRDQVGGTAHSHPGRGTPRPSHEDVTTWKATEAALGRRLTWWITSEDALTVASWDSSGGSYRCRDHGESTRMSASAWLPALRAVSLYGVRKGSSGTAVFTVLAACHPEALTVSEIARRTDLSRAAVRRGASMLAHGKLAKIRVFGDAREDGREEKRICLRI